MHKPTYTPPVSTEAEEQEALYRWINFMLTQYPELENLYHIPNEGKRSIYEGARLKRQGLVPGMPDLCLPSAHGGYHALYIEMKRTKNGKVSEEQSDRLMKLHKLGNFTAVCYGWEEAKDIIEKYIHMPSKEVPLYVQWLKKLFRKKI